MTPQEILKASDDELNEQVKTLEQKIEDLQRQLDNVGTEIFFRRNPECRIIQTDAYLTQKQKQ